MELRDVDRLRFSDYVAGTLYADPAAPTKFPLLPYTDGVYKMDLVISSSKPFLLLADNLGGKAYAHWAQFLDPRSQISPKLRDGR